MSDGGRDSDETTFQRKHFDPWQEEIFKCSKCGWSGPGKSLEMEDINSTFSYYICPKCTEFILCVEHPTIQEAKKNWNSLDDADKATVIALESFRKRFEEQCLKSPDQLPAISAPSFVLYWDFEEVKRHEHCTVIRLGERVIFREPAIYEGYKRFAEVAKILKCKYSDAIKDLIPTSRSELSLLGDDLISIPYVAATRFHILGNKELKDSHNIDTENWRNTVASQDEPHLAAQPKQVSWEEMAAVAHEAFSVFMDSGGIEWSKKAWSLISEAGLAKYSTEEEKYIVYFRFLVLGGIFRDFCDVAFEEYAYLEYGSWADSLNLNRKIVYKKICKDSKWTKAEIRNADFDGMLAYLVEQHRYEVYNVLSKGLGNDNVLYLSLWQSVHIHDETGNEYDETNSEEDAFALTADNCKAYDWVTQGCPRIH